MPIQCFVAMDLPQSFRVTPNTTDIEQNSAVGNEARTTHLQGPAASLQTCFTGWPAAILAIR